MLISMWDNIKDQLQYKTLTRTEFVETMLWLYVGNLAYEWDASLSIYGEPLEGEIRHDDTRH